MRRVGELDGLRGVAILLVLVGHADVAGAPAAATTGISVFLVLSGYLITTVLHRELDETGRLDLAAFFGRRAARLLPALVLSLAVLGPLLVLAGVQLAAVALSASAMLLYVANFARLAFRGPFAHGWSLSLEEQFYFVWPLVMLIASRRRWFAHGLLMAAAASLLVRLVMSDYTSAMYGPATTVGPLLLGAALAVRGQFGPPRPWLGALLVASAAVLWWTEADRLTMLPAAVGTVLLVQARPKWLAARPLVWFGVRSYSIYLWHFPLLFLPQLQVVGAPWAGLLVAVAASVVAAASWRWVEQPLIRRARSWSSARAERSTQEREPAARTTRPSD